MAIRAWVVLNIVDLLVTLLVTRWALALPYLDGTIFREYSLYELNPLIRVLPYPNGYVIYKVAVTAIMVPILYFISKRYRLLPFYLDALFIVIFISGELVQLASG